MPIQEMEQIEDLLANLQLEDIKCDLCQDVNEEPIAFNHCKHCVCAGCAARWLEYSNSCPICRARVTEICIDAEMKKKASQFVRLHPEHEVPNEKKLQQACYEIVFWAVQQRLDVNHPLAVFWGFKPMVPDNLNETQAKEFLQSKREEHIWSRVEVLRTRLAKHNDIFKHMLFDAYQARVFPGNVVASNDDYFWKIVRGRGLMRVPRFTNRSYCSRRFRRSFST
ncbi:unnamed protein product [Caenorhabditis sp. 36 PRJEB53466]|nr:unnamed protein product [Caenorhabditis sp. 36 PRJEB53466]